jgi:TRAP-type C4-dicarboxylate transport system substrate-binding protein
MQRLVKVFSATILGATVAASGAAVAQTVQMKITTTTAGGEANVWMERFKDRVEKRGAGRIRITLYPSSQLGSIPQMIEGMQIGAIEAAVLPPGFLKGVDSRLQVSDTPGAFEDARHAHRTLTDPAFRETFLSLPESRAIKGISIFVPNVSSTATRSKPIRTLEDYKGMKLRVLASDMEVEAMRRLGAAPIPMNLADVMPALQQGVIDGVKAGVTVFIPFKMWSVTKYLSLTGENAIALGTWVSKSWFDKLPGDLQAIVLEEGKRLEDEIANWAQDAHKQMQKTWVDNGGELIELSPAERAKMMKLIADVGPAVVAKNPELKATYEKMVAVAQKTRAGK